MTVVLQCDFQFGRTTDGRVVCTGHGVDVGDRVLLCDPDEGLTAEGIVEARTADTWPYRWRVKAVPGTFRRWTPTEVDVA